ncbi:hypothetical protein PAXRUDRAFT_20818 [Paxillus rubicundulus Ve08.2h10]|uniref:Uncharacterized protein n=1 Tax=Paxillus rubicundulus Ve08.2h10 TaxID=930991 RepID=A0A0D0D0Z4_9AGAM|nr:hypothetical protein PAXRUDRAFT_20818 [Paxillus rubicundulus Ve08.2h10]
MMTIDSRWLNLWKGVVIFRAAQVNSASPEPHSGPSPLSPPSVPPLLHFSVPPHFRLLLNILVPVP